jgi:hypothetical protein
MQKRGRAQLKAKKEFDWVGRIGFAATILGLLIGALVLVARPTISLEAPIDPDDILSTQVAISNDGALPLEDVDVAVWIRKIRGPKSTSIRMAGTKYQPPSREMGIGDRKTITLSPISADVGNPVFEADIGLIICYRPAYVPQWLWFGKPKVFRFDSINKTDGSTRLRQQPDDGKILPEYERLIGTEACSDPN